MLNVLTNQEASLTVSRLFTHMQQRVLKSFTDSVVRLPLDHGEPAGKRRHSAPTHAFPSECIILQTQEMCPHDTKVPPKSWRAKSLCITNEPRPVR